ncbi:hypothetical protein BBP40_002402 [Aspergillus hancockii]|nr:hypothetical protein BBP40_002402 [Aspergillus hancockii]
MALGQIHWLDWTSYRPVDIVGAGLLTGLLYFIGGAIYNVFFHPLSKFPGPVLHSISRIPYSYKCLRGTLPFDMLDLHERYGDIVRVAPDELAVAHPNAWKDIMGYGAKEMEKAMYFFKPIESSPANLVNETGDAAKRLRRHLAPCFSEKAMRDQQPLIKKYVDVFIDKLHEMSAAGTTVNLSEWYNYCTFDIIGDLAFGEPFGYLESSASRTWFKTIFSANHFTQILQALAFYPIVKGIIVALLSRSSKEAFEEQQRQAKEKMMRRMEVGHPRPDLIERLIQKKDELNLSLDNLVSNGESLIIGGSETTATTLSGVTYYLLTNPHALEKITQEVRSTFKSESDIDLVSVGKLTYTFACLDEGMRLYPPVAPGLPRVVPEGGATVLGQFVPGNTYIAIHQWPLYRRKKFFVDAEKFYPERFMGDPRFADDLTSAFQPFHIGPRDCIGRTLAYGEMRLILARLLFNFDITIAEDSLDWVKQKNYLMWQKGELNVHLTPVQRRA